MFKNVKNTIETKIAARKQEQQDTRIVHAADKLPATEINTLMVAIDLPHLANFR